MQIGRRIYFDKTTGTVVIDTGEKSFAVIETTIEQDFESYIELKERVKETVGVIELEYGQYRQDFMECNGIRINPTTLELEFSYPTEGEQPQEPIYQKPLSIEVEQLKSRLQHAEQVSASTSLFQQELLELLLEMGVI